MNTYLGIDFGTTKTLVSCFDEQRGEPRTIRLGRGHDFITTSIYACENGTFLFGEDADDQSIVNGAAYARAFKSGLGSGEYKLVYRDGQTQKKLTSKDLTCAFLKYVRSKCIAQSYACNRAVITRPVNFSPAQITQLEEAARIAGFEDVEFITEPQAIAYAYCKEHPDEWRQNALVVDWGGGTLDMALVSEHGDTVDAHERYRDGMSCGGEDFDDALLRSVKDFLEKDGFGEQVVKDFETQEWLYKTRRRVCRAKEALSRTDAFQLRLGPPYPNFIPINREDFERSIMSYIENAARMAKNLIASVKEQSLKPDAILLVGGSSRISAVVRALERETGLPCRTWDQYGEAVSLGTAIAAYRKWGIGGNIRGNGTSEDSVDRYRRAAGQGYAAAQFNLGECYERGRGVAQDYAEAAKWYREAAEQGYAAAQVNLGKCYETGKGVAQDYAKAAKWYHKAARRGYAAAQVYLGYCYETGQGVTRDYAEAAKWYREAAEQGYAAAQVRLGYCYNIGQGVGQDDTEAAKWYHKAARRGYAAAQVYLGYCYETGQGVTRDYAEAVKWYRRAARQGYAAAQFYLGKCYETGQGVEQDYAEAVKWYYKAAEQGYAAAQFYLGYCYETGQGVARDYAEAVKWYYKAAEQGDTDAQNNLRCHDNGHGVEQDYAEAVKWYRRAAGQEYAAAQNRLGLCYARGHGVEQDYAEAVKWYRKAAEQGFKEAQERLCQRETDA